MMENMLQRILAGKNTVALGGHIRPDGDCVGSSMGLYGYLKECFPEIQTDIYLEEIPSPFKFIKATEEIIHAAPLDKHYDLFISLDCGDSARLGFAEQLYKNAEETFCIDHHVSNAAFADYNYIEPQASSTSELVFNLMDKKYISKSIAEALYMGIAHDTGVFRYSCTAPSTMEAAAELLRKGIDATGIIEKTYYEKTYIQNQMLGRAMMESILLLNKKCIASVLTKSEMDSFNALPSDLEGIVSQLRNTQGVEVAIFIYELEPQEFKVSLRSGDSVDVSVVAQYFGGGGHQRAAGLTMKGTSHDVLNNVVRRVMLQTEGEE